MAVGGNLGTVIRRTVSLVSTIDARNSPDVLPLPPWAAAIVKRGVRTRGLHGPDGLATAPLRSAGRVLGVTSPFANAISSPPSVTCESGRSGSARHSDSSPDGATAWFPPARTNHRRRQHQLPPRLPRVSRSTVEPQCRCQPAKTTNESCAMLRHGSTTDGYGNATTRAFRRSFLLESAGRLTTENTRATQRATATAAPDWPLLPVLAGRTTTRGERPDSWPSHPRRSVLSTSPPLLAGRIP